jgi:hypothetical protein
MTAGRLTYAVADSTCVQFERVELLLCIALEVLIPITRNGIYIWVVTQSGIS